MKQSFYAKTQAIKSLDVRAKQRLCFNGSSFILTCVMAVSPHVNSIVIGLLPASECEMVKFFTL